MGFFDRIFGGKKSEPTPPPAEAPQGNTIPSERLGLNGEYDQSGLAKRVAKAFDEDAGLTDVETLWVAQTGATVVLKGKVPSQEQLEQFVSVAENVNGASSVDTSQVTIG